jgi:translation initiation factor IF-3
LKKGGSLLSGKEVLLVSEEGEQLGKVSVDRAFEIAKEAGLDVVIVAEKADPPVCRILDYGKLRYDQKRKLKNQKKKQHAQKMKEIKFHVNVDVHDYNYKINHAKEFLGKGHKLKLSLVFRGREAAHKAIGFEIIEKAVSALEEFGQLENKPVLSGRTISVSMNPAK